MTRAASRTPLKVVSVFVLLAGLTSTATRTALGIRSCRSPSRFATTSLVKKLMPVALPPGRERLATRPSLTGSSPTAKTIGIVAVAALAASAIELPGVAMTANCRRTRSALKPVVLDRHVLAFDVAGFVEAFPERGHVTRVGISRSVSDKPDHRQRRL